jgi:DNA-binding response OmpR family regulator
MKLQPSDPQLRNGQAHNAEAPIAQRDVGKVGESAAFKFGRFCVLPRSRQLFVDGELVDIGSRAFDLLILLVQSSGAVITKPEIMRHVWPDTFVEDSNLRVQMSILRKVLNQDRDIIKTIPGRGYVFAADVILTSSESEPPALAEASSSFRPELVQPTNVLPTTLATASPDDPVEPKVIVIDDDEDIRLSLQGLMRSVGLHAEVFGSVKEFLATAPSDAPGCMVLDVRLPGRSGLEFQADLAQANIRLPVIFISGYADVPMSVRAMKAGAVEFLTKPLRHQDLLEAIQQAIERDRARGKDESRRGNLGVLDRVVSPPSI